MLYKISEEGVYRLNEDLIFDSTAFLSDIEIIVYIESDNVTFDLYNNKILMSDFAANIFKPFYIIKLKDGIKNICIKNGTIDRCSGYGIYACNVTNLKLENINILNFEICGLYLDNIDTLEINNLMIGPTYDEICFNSNFHISKKLLTMCKSIYNENKQKIKENKKLFNEFKSDLESLYKDVKEIIKCLKNKNLPKKHNFLLNDYPNESSYGLYLNNCKNVFISNLNIDGVIANVDDILTLSKNESKVTDICGFVIRILDDLKDGFFQKDKLKSLQLSSLKIMQYLNKGRQNTITSDVLYCINNKLNINFLFDKDFKVSNNHDYANNKLNGTIGFYINNSENVELNNINIKNIVNVGPVSRMLNCEYILTDNISSNEVYTGSNSTGILCSNVKDLSANNINISDIKSCNGYSKGIRFINTCTNIKFINTSINNIFAGFKFLNNYWYGYNNNDELIYKPYIFNPLPHAFGICIEKDNGIKDVKTPDIKINNVLGIMSFDRVWINSDKFNIDNIKKHFNEDGEFIDA
ncbi:MAG: hypothetical protein QW478_01860 [Candidatus Micrarchaeaceae archaeon]